MRLRDFFMLHRSDRQALLFLLCLAVAILLALHFAGDEVTDTASLTDPNPKGDGQEVAAGKKAAPSYYAQPVEHSPERFAFDPNTADSTQLLRLGLQPWQVRNIYKYRACGGIYRRKEDFARLYGLTAKQYKELEPYIRISSDYLPATTLFPEDRQQRDTLQGSHKLGVGETVDLTVADTAELRRVPGIGSYYARRIVAYGERLGGYVSTSQLKEIESFPETALAYFIVSSSEVRKLNINQLSLNDLKRHPYINYYQARAIIDYRRQHGRIADLSDLRLLPDFPAEAIERLRPYVCY